MSQRSHKWPWLKILLKSTSMLWRSSKFQRLSKFHELARLAPHSNLWKKRKAPSWSLFSQTQYLKRKVRKRSFCQKHPDLTWCDRGTSLECRTKGKEWFKHPNPFKFTLCGKPTDEGSNMWQSTWVRRPHDDYSEKWFNHLNWLR